MKWNDLHLIKGSDLNLVYHPNNRMMVVGDLAFNVLKALQAEQSVEVILHKYADLKGEIEKFLHSLESTFDTKEAEDTSTETTRHIRRITLHVSNDCNLRCKYCYAEGGNYKQERRLMTMETAQMFVDFCCNNFDSIGYIVFFGREPMLNIEVMDFICTQFKTYYSSGKSSFLPWFAIITNGTILTPRALQFIKEHISLITVSIDGPKTINDTNRVYSNGRGSYEHIARFIRTILNETNVKIQYETTYTQSHVDAHLRYRDIARFMKDEFGINGFISNDLNIDPNIGIDDIRTIDYDHLATTDFIDLPEYFWLILESFVQNKTRMICKAGKGVLGINCEGTIYPCHILNGKERYSLGNINGKNIFTAPENYQTFLSNTDFKSSETCKSCWAYKLCSGCPLQGFRNQKTGEFQNEPNAEFCQGAKYAIDLALLAIARIRRNPELWTALLGKVQNRC